MSSGPTPAAADEVLDLRKMRETLGSEEMVDKTLRSFLTRAPKTTTNLRNAYDAKDFAKLRRDAHSLKGACGYVASEHLRESSLSLQLAAEGAGRGEEIDPPIGAHVQQVIADLTLLCEEITKTLGNNSGATTAAGSSSASGDAQTEPSSTAVPSGSAPLAAASSSLATSAKGPSADAVQYIDLRKMRDCRACHRP